MLPRRVSTGKLPVCSQVRDCHVLWAHEQQHSDPLPLSYVGPKVGAPAQMQLLGKKGQVLLGLILVFSPQVNRCTVPKLTMGSGKQLLETGKRLTQTPHIPHSCHSPQWGRPCKAAL